MKDIELDEGSEDDGMVMLSYVGIGALLSLFWFAVGIGVGRYFAG